MVKHSYLEKQLISVAKFYPVTIVQTFAHLGEFCVTPMEPEASASLGTCSPPKTTFLVWNIGAGGLAYLGFGTTLFDAKFGYELYRNIYACWRNIHPSTIIYNRVWDRYLIAPQAATLIRFPACRLRYIWWMPGGCPTYANNAIAAASMFNTFGLGFGKTPLACLAHFLGSSFPI
ncbi:hypothetical protein BYT27DRAFT_7216851 [Phlegmacium glaucopus]|nr:hypothetical protein BYT27DRAFT_7216851 [Phlegmacium glaucopus]